MDIKVVKKTNRLLPKVMKVWTSSIRLFVRALHKQINKQKVDGVCDNMRTTVEGIYQKM
jgi:hypothetical protein